MKLVTWNIQWGRGADGRVDLERIADHARRFADFDVLCLQEVSAGYPELPGCDGGDQFERIAAMHPQFTPVPGIATDVAGPAGRRRFGNMLLSRLPVRRIASHLLPWPADATTMSMQRVAVEVTVETSSGPLRVTTTHLEYYSERQRAAQIERLRELHREGVAHARSVQPGTAVDGPFEHVPRAAPAILAGDLNLLPDSVLRPRLLAAFDDATPPLRDAWEIVHPDAPHAPTVGVHDKEQWPGRPFCFDYVLVSADLAHRVCDLRVDAGTSASDHQPLLLEIE